MIKEIKFPFPTVFDSKISFNSKFYRPRLPKRKYKHKTYDYIAFDRDPTFVDEFADACGLPRDFAETILVVFFDEIKHTLLGGEEILLSCFGKLNIGRKRFYISTSRFLAKKLYNIYIK